ncbi:MAG: PorT family protein [Flavobacterium sp.]|nr:PorT family protein [Pedobacter sp.]
MKTKIIIFFLTLSPILLIAQNNEKRKTQLGFTISPTFGWLSAPTGQMPVIKGDGLRTGFAYGILGDFPFSDNYYFSTALTVSTLNAKSKEQFTTSATTSSGNSIYKLQYLEVPLTLKLKSKEINNQRYYGQFGLNTGVKISSKQNIMYSNSTTADVNNVDIGNNINTFRAGLLIGGGVEWMAGQNMNILTGVSYSNGFSDIFNGVRKAKNSCIVLNLGVFF